MKWPRFLVERWERAEAAADAAEMRLLQAKVEQAGVKRLADEARRIKSGNGFTDAIRHAMDVRR